MSVGAHQPLPSRDAIVATARQSIARGSKSFAAASLLFARPTRERAWLLYAWCRACDDIADGQDHGHGERIVTDAPARLAAMRALTEAALAGQVVGEPAFDALRIVAAETAMPAAFARDLIAGFALDADEWRPVSEADLYRYCYHVAGVVGCMMAVVMGVPPDDHATLDHACDLGIAFQLANIARDICADAMIDRCYLPVDWLVEMDIPPGEFIKPPYRPQLAILARRLAERAATFEESARVGTSALDFRSAWAVLAAADIYGAIARQVAADPAAAIARRVTIPGRRKLAFMGLASWQAASRRRIDPSTASRPDWRRPISPAA